jgi:TldD protein
VLIHEIVGHALEADVVLDGRSWLAEEDGRVAPSELLILDDPRRGRAAWRIDDEGQRARPVPLIRSGRVAGRLHDLRTAGRSGESSTGHGRCASYREPVRPRMGCTFVAAGRWSPDEILNSVDHGVYIRRMEAASVDLSSGRAIFRVTDSDRIVGGKRDAPLHPHLLVVEGRSALAGMDRVADDLAFDTCVGSCIRVGQALAMSVGAPTICIGRTWVAR